MARKMKKEKFDGEKKGSLKKPSILKRLGEGRRKAPTEMEHRVEERTAELARMNEQLKHELNQRKRAEEELRKSEARFRELAELLPEIVFETDLKGNITYCNRVGFAHFGYSKEEFDRGLNCHLTVAPEDRKRLRKNISRLMKGKKLGSGEYMAQRKDGGKFPVIINSYVMLDENRHPVGLRGIMVEITELKRAEEKILNCQSQLRSLTSELSLAEERIRRLTATELHDRIAQTVAFAKMKLGMLQKSTLEPSLSKTLDEVMELLNETIQNTRSLISELSSPILYELGLVPATEWLIQQMQKRHGINLTVEDDKQPKPLNNDVRVLLFQAVRELLVNVTKHAEASDAKVSFMKDADKIRIEISDNGIGFNPSEFGPRVDKMRGFGLFSIQERLKIIGGHIKIESEPENGTRVILVAPLKRQVGRE